MPHTTYKEATVNQTDKQSSILSNQRIKEWNNEALDNAWEV